MAMYNKALSIARNAHDKQIRKQTGVPYITHPYRVAKGFQDDLRKTIAILHDVFEDTDTLAKELIPLSYLEENRDDFMLAVEAIQAITRLKDEDYFVYITRCNKNPLAREIKIADMMDNLSDMICKVNPSLKDRYDKALKILIP